MGRWERSKQLASASWAVLKQDKELIVLPLISGLASIVIAVTFLLPVYVSAHHVDELGNDELTLNAGHYLLLFVMYVLLAYIAVFFKTALLCGADERMRGGNPTLSSAISGAGKHAGKILPWAVVSATVSVILRALEDRAGFVGRIVIGIVGVAWAVVTFLVLPVLVFEGVGVGEAVKRSGAMLKHTWGENLIVNGGIGLFAFLLALPAFVLIPLGFVTGSVAVGVALAVVGVLWLIAVTCWANAMSGIFQLALYRYATEGVAPPAFATADLGHAFTVKDRQRTLGL